jgi:CheY-like chemotaxis protein
MRHSQELSLKEFEPKEIQIQSVIDAAIGRLGNIAGVKPVAIVAAFPAHFPNIAGDRSTFIEILAGLLAHSIRKTERDEVRVRAQLIPAELLQIPSTYPSPHLDPNAEPWALISISDYEGAYLSITPEDQIAFEAAIRDQFPSLEDCVNLIQPLGGYIWPEHHEASAKTFWLAIPIATTGPVLADISRVRKAVEAQLSGGDRTGKSILLFVEDKSLRELLKDELATAGYRVVVCLEALEVLPLARNEHPDLLILDLQAQEPTAFDLAKSLKQDPNLARIPVLVLTTVPDSAGGLRMDTAGFLVRSEGTGAMLATVHSAFSSGVAPFARVLVVEANEAIREQMIVHIQARGHPVVEASSAEEALALTERTRISVVMANARLAQARDYWLLRQLKSVSPDLDIYVLAESISEEEGRAAVQRGASGFGDTGRLPDLLNKMGPDQETNSIE